MPQADAERAGGDRRWPGIRHGTLREQGSLSWVGGI
jgi:hypothetical protein